MDVDRVLSWFEAGTLVRPDPLRPTTVSLARALAAIGGAPVDLDEPSLRISRAIGQPEHVIFVLVDGLGLELVEALPETSFLRGHLAMEMQAVFPSSTAPALTSLATGDWPSQHGLLGWFVYLPGRNLHTISLPFRERFSARPLETLGVSGSELFNWQALLPSYRAQTQMLMPTAIVDSAYTASLSEGAARDSYDTLDAAVDLLIRRFSQSRPASYTYFYYAKVDSTAHDHGPTSPRTRAAVEVLDSALARLFEGLEGRAHIVVSSDHGGIDIDAAHKLILDQDDRPAAMLKTPPSGEPRAPLFHVRAGEQADFAEAFRAQFGEQFALLSADEVFELELLGPGKPSSTTRSRLGDFLAISAGGEALVYARDKGYQSMIGFHGGLDPREMRIPLIVA